MINLFIGGIATLLSVLFIIKGYADYDNEVNKELEEIMDECIKEANL